jgi:hypothetical protein
MPVWNVAPVDQRPEVEFIRWRIFEIDLHGIDGHESHLVSCQQGVALGDKVLPNGER